MSDQAKLDGYLLIWRTGYASRQWVCEQLNKHQSMREKFLKTLKLSTAADLMEAIVKHGN